MAQWYGKLPAAGKVNENWPPGAMVPEFHPAAFDVEVCATESVFIQVTRVPAATVRFPGIYARSPSPAAFTGIVTVEDGSAGGGDGAGVGDGAAGGDESPQASADIKRTEAKMRRNESMETSEMKE